MRVVGCVLEWEHKFLLLHRASESDGKGTWGLPSGKVEKEEGDDQALVREVFEETGYKVSKDEVEYLHSRTIAFPGYSVEFLTYRIKLSEPFAVALNVREHDAYKWVTIDECLALPNLIKDLPEILQAAGYKRKT